MPYYALFDMRDENRGSIVAKSWEDAKLLLSTVPGLRPKKCNTLDDAVYYSKHGVLPVKDVCSDELHVYTDGSSDGSYAGCGVHVVNHEEYDFAGIMYSGPYTNNRAELFAISLALDLILTHNLVHDDDGNKYTCIKIFSDSAYAIGCLTTWRTSWQRTNFKNNTIKNRNIIESIYKQLDAFPLPVELHKVKGHEGVRENEIADALATQGMANAKEYFTEAESTTNETLSRKRARTKNIHKK